LRVRRRIALCNEISASFVPSREIDNASPFASARFAEQGGTVVVEIAHESEDQAPWKNHV
jgi:hypothetical protein